MTWLPTIVGVVVAFVLGYLVLPFIFALPTFLAARLFRRSQLAYFLSRYGGQLVETVAFFLILTWMIDRWRLVEWPIWVVFAILTLLHLNTLITFDVKAHASRSGIWAEPLKTEAAEEAAAEAAETAAAEEVQERTPM
jgi:hypothetical protein